MHFMCKEERAPQGMQYFLAPPLATLTRTPNCCEPWAAGLGMECVYQNPQTL